MEKLELIKIKNWVFDPLKKTLTTKDSDNNQIVETLEAKHADLLHCLISHQDEIITRDQLIELVWKSRFVDDRTINATISRLRKILGGSKDEFIKTHPKLGYSFQASIEYIDRPIPEKIKQSQKEKSKFKLYKTLIVIGVMCFSTLIWFTLTGFEKEPTILTKNEVNIEPLTYEEGWEFEPSLSFDGKYLAYVGKTNNAEIYKIKIKNLERNETITLPLDSEARSPIWSSVTNSLFYAKENNGGCVIQRVNIVEHFVFSPPEDITSCGMEYDFPSISIDNNENWLYFTYKELNISSIIKRINLDSGTIEPLTVPLQYGGDYQAKLNKDNTQLAFIRTYDNYQSYIFLIDLDTLQVEQLTNATQDPSYLTWGETSQALIFVDISNNSLNSINIKTLAVTPLFQHHEQIETPIQVDNNQFILGIGDSYKSNVVKATTIENSNILKTSKYIHSTFKDHEIQISNDPMNEKTYFVSNRSGGYQIWQKSNSVYKQLTNFHDKFAEIIELILSPDQTKLLFKLNEKLHVFNLQLETIHEISHPTNLIGNAAWSCDSDATLLITGKKGGEWGLYNYSLETKDYFLEAKDIVSIKSVCDKYSYALVKANTFGIFLQERLLEDDSSSHVFPSLNLSENLIWDVSDKYLLAFHDSKFHRVNLVDLKATEFIVNGYIVNNPRLIGNSIYFNGLEVNNTYIGRFAIPKVR
ncbi:winged helix-turn-helix domain-containing protein [Thalassotalea marina]|uniref:OmpR/PhoB-type domain-containing protein n=1 Tax=Thalassotalea marina TaxID=1673741 RepID=A0A919ENS7_9GAMM|nr:winged helix-turn-helix domain-containing protein [Thalassotalea marina]GHG03686.1 hypothetical protein GCM10017161_36180 [Thalassotalea marina]